MVCYYFIPFLTKFRSILFCSALFEPEIIDITDSFTFVFWKKADTLKYNRVLWEIIVITGPMLRS